jgi:hypothetical protein
LVADVDVFFDIGTKASISSFIEDPQDTRQRLKRRGKLSRMIFPVMSVTAFPQVQGDYLGDSR